MLVKSFFIILFVIIFSCLKSTSGQNITILSNVSKSFEAGEIVPDVISVAPKKFIFVIYFDNSEPQLGNVLTPSGVWGVPYVSWEYNPNKFYTLCMIDPDAPSRQNPKYREWLHWLVVNIPGRRMSSGQYLADYVGACPPKETGLHRYVFLLFLQKNRTEFDEKHLVVTSAEGRENFSIGNFAKKYDLGDPIAGNYFLAQYDDYVPILYRILRIQ